MTDKTNELKYWTALNRFPKFGSKRLIQLYNFFPTMEEAFFASSDELMLAGINERVAEEFVISRYSINPDAEWEALQVHKIGIITFKDEGYPALLREIYDPPAILYYRGQLPEATEFSLAVVGTRKVTTYGRQITSEVVAPLASAGLVITSGMAFGVDALAHHATTEASGKTVAVLGSGLDPQHIYPANNRYLAQKIIESGGVLLSEFPIGTMPLKPHFPIRNRIISGMSLGTLVIEAAERSGSLITAKLALDQNREVFAIPGPIHAEHSVGPNSLIKMGAKCVTTSADILDALHLAELTSNEENKQILPDTKEEAIILPELSKQPKHVDEIAKKTKLTISTINSTLTMMEMKGKVKHMGGMHYILG